MDEVDPSRKESVAIIRASDKFKSRLLNRVYESGIFDNSGKIIKSNIRGREQKIDVWKN